MSCPITPSTNAVPNQDQLLQMIKTILPEITYSAHKGSAGRIGIIGGSQRYTGAPYFSAISALKLGADLAHVITTSNAAIVIKTYSPELIVHPILDSPSAVSEISQLLDRLHALVIGPGLDREPGIFEIVKGVITMARKRALPIVLDADAVMLVAEFPEMIHGYNKAIITPNAMEFDRLLKSRFGPFLDKRAIESNDVVSQLAQSLGQVTILRKGLEDTISNSLKCLECAVGGSPRRCGGQGDILSGVLATFTYWCQLAMNRDSIHPLLNEYGPNLIASYAAAAVTKRASELAFAKHGRSMLASDMIEEINESSKQLFGSDV